MGSLINLSRCFYRSTSLDDFLSFDFAEVWCSSYRMNPKSANDTKIRKLGNKKGEFKDCEVTKLENSETAKFEDSVIGKSNDRRIGKWTS